MLTTSIIIPFYNNWQLTHQRLMELYTKVSGITEIVLVNDASTDPEIDGGVAFWQKHVQKSYNIRYIKSDENKGFGSSMNLGASKAIGDILILLSNDVEIFNDFVFEITELLYENQKYFIGGEILWQDTGWNVIDGKVMSYANGWLLACMKETWQDIGGFDLKFGKFDGEDLDVSITAVSKGYILKGLSKSRLHHLGGATIWKLYPNRQEYTKKNIEYLRQKWTGKV